MIAIPDSRCREILTQLGYFDQDKVTCVFSLTDEQVGLLERVSQVSGKSDAELLEWLCHRVLEQR